MKLMRLVISNINASKQESHKLYTFIQTIGNVRSALPLARDRSCLQFSASAGLRIGRYLPEIIPKLLEYNLAAPEGEVSEGTQELWSSSLQVPQPRTDEDGPHRLIRDRDAQAFESILMRCPQEVTPFVDKARSP